MVGRDGERMESGRGEVDEGGVREVKVGRYGDGNDWVMVWGGEDVVNMLIEERVRCGGVVSAVRARGHTNGVGSFEGDGGGICE